MLRFMNGDVCREAVQAGTMTDAPDAPERRMPGGAFPVSGHRSSFGYIHPDIRSFMNLEVINIIS